VRATGELRRDDLSVARTRSAGAQILATGPTTALWPHCASGVEVEPPGISARLGTIIGWVVSYGPVFAHAGLRQAP